jgi:MFS family permease
MSYNYKLLLAARFFQGVGLAPYEALVNAVVGDLYFVHERGKRMALTNFCVFGGSFMTPIIVGKISHTLGWQWTFYFVAIFSAIMFPLLFFFVPEVAFRRDDRFNTDIVVLGSNQIAIPVGEPLTTESNRASKEGYDNTAESSTGDAVKSMPRPKKTFVQSLMPFDGRKTDENFFKLFLRPFPLFLHPAVLWVSQTIISSSGTHFLNCTRPCLFKEHSSVGQYY